MHRAVVALHELLDRERVGGVLVAEDLRQPDLVVEQQPVLAPAGEHVQAEAHLPQEGLRLLEPAQLRRGEEAVRDQLVERVGAEVPLRHPADGLDVAQAARAGLDVGLEVVGGVVGLQVALGLLAHLGLEELLRPARRAPGASAARMLREQRGAAGEQARLEQRRHDADIGGALLGALLDGAHAVADFEPDVPEEGDQPLDLRRCRRHPGRCGTSSRMSMSEAGCSSPRP